VNIACLNTTCAISHRRCDMSAAHSSQIKPHRPCSVSTYLWKFSAAHLVSDSVPVTMLECLRLLCLRNCVITIASVCTGVGCNHHPCTSRACLVLWPTALESTAAAAASAMSHSGGVASTIRRWYVSSEECQSSCLVVIFVVWICNIELSLLRGTVSSHRVV